ncbi:MAG: hypothetical protein KatS3mg024_2485 [Armatimonadota bacterium]|nr:MAG: hypothetical protein KatS3mg024_2485 [Armatimonadota bacterium]
MNMYVDRLISLLDSLKGERYSRMTHKCPECGKELRGVLEIAHHGMSDWRDVDYWFYSEESPSTAPFVTGCQALYNTAIFVKMAALCKDTGGGLK